MKQIYAVVIIFIAISVGCESNYHESGWFETPYSIIDRNQNSRQYLIYIPRMYNRSNKLVIYFTGSVCAGFPDYFGNRPEHMRFLEDYASNYNFILALPIPIYEYKHQDMMCYGWVQTEEIDFIDKMVDAISKNIFFDREFEIYVLGLSAGACMSYYYAYLHNDRVSGVFSHGQAMASISHLIKDPSQVGWRLGLAYNRYDYPDIISLVNEDYDYFSGLGIDLRIWRDADDNRHSWSKVRTDEYLRFMFFGE